MTSLKQHFLIMTTSFLSPGHCGNYVWARVPKYPCGSSLTASQSLSMGFPRGLTDIESVSGIDGAFWDLLYICIDFNMGWAWREVGGWDSASICSSDMAYFSNSICLVWLRAGTIDEERVMMRPMPWYSGVITSRECGMGCKLTNAKMQMFFPVDSHARLSLFCSNSAY